MPLVLNRVIIYTKKIDEMVRFYSDCFDYRVRPDENDRIVELRPPGDGATLLLHPAAKGQKEGQSLVKLVFDVEDLGSARTALVDAGIEVGPIHDAAGYQFANLKDPGGNSVSISSRAFRSLDD